MIETGEDSIRIFKYLRDSPSSEQHLKLVFFASQTVDDRVVVYHYNTITQKVVVRFCTLPDRTFGTPSSFVLSHATPDVNGLNVSFPLMPTVHWVLDLTRYKLVDPKGGVLIGMHTTVQGLGTAKTTCWSMHHNPAKKGSYLYEQSSYNVQNPLLSSIVGSVGQ
jgi:hypothetical protein